MIERKALKELDYFKILSFIEEYANSESTKKAVQKILPAKNFEDAEKSLKEFSELKKFLERGVNLPISSFPDIYPLIEKAKKEGVFFESAELKDFLKVLQLLDKISSFIDELFQFSSLRKKIGEILGENLSVSQPYVLERLENTVDEEGNILDTASSMLKYLRKQIKSTEERIKQKLEEIINRQDIAVFLQDRFITKRNNRWVIPVRMDSKGQVSGIIHDVSRSGETAFIEPAEITTLSKRLEELLIEERLEVIRILKEISFEIHQISETLEREFNLLVYLDKMFSLYKFAQKFNAEVPELSKYSQINLINAKHPLLMLSKEEVVPLTLEMKDKKVMVITGPNAGGKTVTIKTIGLLTAMALSGIPITASPSSVIPFVKSIFVDLYHEGSIEKHLSSFTSHIMSLKEMVEKADSQSLIILDEIGTNTDPEEGSALACAILEELLYRGAFSFVTTHLSKVKLFATTKEGMEVAAMLFDENTMTPLYRLSIGRFTPSYTLDVARKYGFPETLIKKAYEMKGTQEVKIYELIDKLEKLKTEYEEKIKEVEKVKINLIHEKQRFERELLETKEKEKRVLEQSRHEAQIMISNLKKQINQLYEEAKKADRQRLREISKKMSDISKQFISEKVKTSQNVKVGDTVRIKNLNVVGKLSSVEDRRVKIQTETIQVESDIEDIEIVETVSEVPTQKQIKLPDYEEPITVKLDIRGLRVDEAIPLVERFLNDLSLSEARQCIIMHGIGKRILRNTVRDYIKDHPAVKGLRKGSPQEGGDAVTVVEMI